MNNVSKAMNWLADTREGERALKSLAEAGEALRQKIPVKLNNAELKYVIQQLWAQRAVDGWDKRLHFEIHPVASETISIKGTKIDGITIPASMDPNLRVRNLGFIIRAAIPQAHF